MIKQRSRQTTFIQNLGNRKGQVALFIALAFQVLFLFFAMVINVGLLVHHKINLQNSVDLAAYYGAMKQAENMNAIAHINYQIRQSWKLLAWRYRMLGSAGEWDENCHPFNKPSRRITGSTADVADSNGKCYDFQEAPSFCVTYIPFKPMPPGENTCKSMASRSGTKFWESPKVVAGFQGFSKSIRATSEALRERALRQCQYFGSYNYYLLGKFVVAFNFDQSDRMTAIAELSKATSLNEGDLYDIDGESVNEGVKNTLNNNLTAANRNGLADFKFFNSLGHEACNKQATDEDQPAKWLSAIRIFPGFGYIDTSCRNSGITPVPKELSNYDDALPEHRGDAGFEDDIRALSEFIGYREKLNDNYNFSMGVEKNPWCMAYVGVSASSAPKIPFSPFGSVTLKARAFYKPFGGRVGPWYYKMWRRGSPFSEGGPNDKIDPLLPPRVTADPRSQLSTLSEDAAQRATRAANYSRYVGDTIGLKSSMMLAYNGEAIYKLDSGWRNGTAPESGNSIYSNDDAPNFAHWDELPFDFADKSGKGDLMAFDSKQNQPSRMRLLEMAAILPDTFDATYYSIEPDFYHNYYLRLREGYFKGPGKNFNKVFRPDLGYRKGYTYGSYDLEKFSVKDQFTFINDPGGEVINLKNLVSDKFTFTLSDWKHVLTGWAPVDLMNYKLDPKKFGKCDAFPIGADRNDPKPPTSGNCVVGGSTGYSVKMVSSDYLRSPNLNLGGDNAGSGPLLNPPPPDDEF